MSNNVYKVLKIWTVFWSETYFSFWISEYWPVLQMVGKLILIQMVPLCWEG